MSKEKLNAIDLFAGAGGLSHGARAAGFKVVAAVEVDGRYASTYRKNHPETELLLSDIRSVTSSDLTKRTEDGHVDLLMGCAPCQGFCSLTSKRSATDPRNKLLLEMARLLEEVRPTVVLMENVPGLAQRGAPLFHTFVEGLERSGYRVSWENVQLADYGVPQKRRRLVLLAGRDFDLRLPPATHSRHGGGGLLPWRTVRDVIGREQKPLMLSEGNPKLANWHVVRSLRPSTLARLDATMAGQMRYQLTDRLLPSCHQDGYKGFRNVYMRMRWDGPSPTITAGCTTPAKGRFGHPSSGRTTISVREAATLQTFPKSFRFDTDKIEVACEMIGNAVPPLFAHVVIAHIRQELIRKLT